MTAPVPGRPTIVMKIVDSVIKDLVRVVMGLVCMAAGFWAVAYEAKHPPVNNIILIAGLLFAAVGFLLIPYVFQQFQTIVIFVAPFAENAPVIGPMFRRKTDTPRAIDEPPPEAKP